MPGTDDITLLREYAEDHSEAAFAALVGKYVNLVYSTALRSTGNTHAAEEISQAVFIILARKAGSLGAKTVLSGWLYQTARLTSANFLRTEVRRRHREQEAYMQSLLSESISGADTWRQIAPLLDDAMERLGEKDRNAVVLRFFENKSLAEVGAALGATEDAAKMRVARALEKLRMFFEKRGISTTTAIVSGAISAHSVQAAPAALAGFISAVAVTKGATVSGSTLTLIQGALKIMAWTKAKTAIVASATVLLATATTTVTIKEIQEHRAYPWQIEGHDSRVLDQQPPQVRILSSRVKYASWGKNMDKNGHAKLMGTGVLAKTVVLAAHDFSYPVRVVGFDKLPAGKFDYIGSLPMGNEEALQKEVKKKFGVIARIETRPCDVLLLKIQNRNAPGLRQSGEDFQNGGRVTRETGPGNWSCKNSPLSSLAAYLEEYLQVPVVEQTGLTNRFDINLKWKQSNWGNANPDGLTQALLDQVGLELVPTNMPIEMLVVEKAN